MGEDRIAKLRDRVRGFLDETISNYETSEDTFHFTHGSTRVRIRLFRWTRKYTILRVQALVLQDVVLAGNEDMFEEFSRLNDRLLFGKIFWSPDQVDVGTIILEHNLIGETLDYKEFHTALMALAMAADDLDDTLQRYLGGRRGVD